MTAPTHLHLRRWEVLDFSANSGTFHRVALRFTEAGARLHARVLTTFLRPRYGEFELVLHDRKTGALYRIEGQR